MEFFKNLFGPSRQEQSSQGLSRKELTDAAYMNVGAKALVASPNSPALMKKAFEAMRDARDANGLVPGQGRSDMELMRLVHDAAASEYLEQNPGRGDDLALDLLELRRAWATAARSLDLWNEEVDGAALERAEEEFRLGRGA